MYISNTTNHLLVFRSQTPSRSDHVSLYLTVSCAQAPVRNFPESLPTGSHYTIYEVFIFSSRVCVGVLVCWCVQRGLALSHHQRGADFGREGVCGGPYFCDPSTPARVQHRFEFVELGREMSSNCPTRHTGITGSYDNRLVIPEVPLYKFEDIEYLQGTRAPPV